MAEESEGVISATWQEAKAHPYIIGGAVVALAVFLWWSGRKPSQASQQFTFSYGPSDAQVRAGTQLAIAQQADQTAVNLATIKAGTDAATSKNYFDYLTSNSLNQLTASETATAAQVSMNAMNNYSIINGQNVGLEELVNNNLTWLSAGTPLPQGYSR